MIWKSGPGFVASPPRRLPAKVGAHDGQHRAACKHWRRKGGSSSGTGYIYEDAEHEVEDSQPCQLQVRDAGGPDIAKLGEQPQEGHN